MKKEDTSKITTNLKNIFYVDKEIQDILKKYYQIRRYLKSFPKRTISFSFVRTRTFDRARTFTRTFDPARTFLKTFDRAGTV